MLPSDEISGRLVGLALVGLLALNYPLLSLFSRAQLIFGIPLLYLYLFIFWGIFIFLTAMAIERKAGQQDNANDPQQESHN